MEIRGRPGELSRESFVASRILAADLRVICRGLQARLQFVSCLGPGFLREPGPRSLFSPAGMPREECLCSNRLACSCSPHPLWRPFSFTAARVTVAAPRCPALPAVLRGPPQWRAVRPPAAVGRTPELEER